MDDASLPWTEKYRPHKLKDVEGQDEIVKRLEAYAKSGSMPNLMFAGRAGIGKTASAIALANELYGGDVNRNLLELNASDERGIDVIRGKIKDFAGALAYGGMPFKIIFLDESDSLTRDAQNALRRTMERYSKTCRFVLSCNYSSKIIEPIQSRCALFRFTPLTDGDIEHRIRHVAEEEGVDIDGSAIKAMVYVAEGDMRKAINTLQVAASLGKKVTEDTVYRVSSRARPEEVAKMLDTAISGEFMDARKLLDKLLYEYALSAEDVLLQVYRAVVNSKDIGDGMKIRLIDRIGEASFRVTEGANERIQLEAFIAQLALLPKKG